MPPLIRLADGADAGSVQAVYAPIVRDTAISFELEIPDVPEMERRITRTLEHFAGWSVRAMTVSWGMPTPPPTAPGPRTSGPWTCQCTFHADARQMGVGQALYRSLFGLLTLQGFTNAFAGTTLPNPASVGLHNPWGLSKSGSTGMWVTSWTGGTMWCGGNCPWGSMTALRAFPSPFRTPSAPRLGPRRWRVA